MALEFPFVGMSATHGIFTSPGGVAYVEGTLTLDYARVRCIADIDLATLEGKGHLEKVDTVSA